MSRPKLCLVAWKVTLKYFDVLLQQLLDWFNLKHPYLLFVWKWLNQLCTEGAKEMNYLRRHLLIQEVVFHCFLVNNISIDWFFFVLFTMWAVPFTATLVMFLCSQLWMCSVSSYVLNVSTPLPVIWWFFLPARGYHWHQFIHPFESRSGFFSPTADGLTLGIVCESLHSKSACKSNTSPRWNVAVFQKPVLSLL